MKKIMLNLMLLLPLSLFAENSNVIKGKVKDIHTGLPLFECHVYLAENYGVLTDENGLFTLEVSKEYEEAMLFISYVGYETYFKPVSEINQEFVVVSLIEETPMLDEVVVVANPWNEFDEIVANLSSTYNSREEFYAVMFKELKKIEKETNGRINKDSNKAAIEPGKFAFIVLALIILATFALMAKSLIIRLDNLSAGHRNQSISLS